VDVIYNGEQREQSGEHRAEPFLAGPLPDNRIWFVSLGEGHWYMGRYLRFVPGLDCHMLDGVRERIPPTAGAPSAPVRSRAAEPVFIHAEFVAQVVPRPPWFDLPEGGQEA
jgi:hypothetical protein